jgi:hypothetical protein
MKVFLRRVFELPALFPLREQVWKRAAIKASQSARRVAEEYGYQALDSAGDFFGPGNSRETLFLLGGGSSINELSNSHFEHMRSQASIGFNVWAIHPFIPDVYSFETGKDKDGPSEDTQYISQRLLHQDVIEANPKFLFLRPTLPATPRNLVQVPEALRRNQFMYGRANLPTRNSSNLRRDIHRILQSYKLGEAPSNVLLDNGATVVRMLFFGALQGFKKIVLTGIDLDDRPYFWLSPDYAYGSEEITRVFPRRNGVPHDTLETTDRPFPVDQVIVALSQSLKDHFGISVYIGSSRSTLAPALPVYPWPET